MLRILIQPRYLLSMAFGVLMVVMMQADVHRQLTTGIDYPIFYEAANNHGIAPGYIYLPFFAWILVPLASLPLPTSVVIWYLIHAIGVIATVFMILPKKLPAQWMDIGILVIATVALARLVLLNAELGQVNTLVLLCIIMSFRVRDNTYAGCLLGLATAIKLIPLIVLPFLLLSRRTMWVRVVAGFSAMVVLSLALPALSGFSFAGVLSLGGLVNGATANMSMADFLPKPVYMLIVVLLYCATLLLMWKREDTATGLVFSSLLLITIPSVVRKAHLLFGMPVISTIEDQHMMVRLATLFWAAGTLGTVVWPPAAAVGSTAALCSIGYAFREKMYIRKRTAEH